MRLYPAQKFHFIERSAQIKVPLPTRIPGRMIGIVTIAIHFSANPILERIFSVHHQQYANSKLTYTYPATNSAQFTYNLDKLFWHRNHLCPLTTQHSRLRADALVKDYPPDLNFAYCQRV